MEESAASKHITIYRTSDDRFYGVYGVSLDG